MKNCLYLFIFLVFSGCKHDTKVNTSFYYWKTIYNRNKTEESYIKNLHVRKLYVRIMDVDIDETASNPVPISPITFNEMLSDTVEIVPVVFIVNNVLKDISKARINDLAKKICNFVVGKVTQGGKTTYEELQIDCDWTVTSRDNYFYLLKQIAAQPLMQHKIISSTLRLHQLKNQKRNGIPPVNKVMLMCYNMGNLRQYGNQNSIIELNELKKYANDNIVKYPMPIDIGLPLFSWAVVFKKNQYAGLSKRISLADLHDKKQFIFIRDKRYQAIDELPQYGLGKGDEIRWEDVPVNDLNAATEYLSSIIKQDSLNLIYFHLDEAVLKTYTPAELQKNADILR